MDAVIINEKNKRDWDRFVNENPDTIAWQSYDWSNVLKRHYSFDFFPIALYEGSDICGILPLYRIRTNISGNCLMSVPYAVAGGIAAGNAAARKALLDKAIHISKKYDSCPITLKQYKLKVEGDLAVDENYYNRELTLSTDIGEVWSRLSSENRQSIDQTGDSGLILDYPSKDSAAFFKMLLKHQHSRGIPCVRGRWIDDLLDFNMYSIALLKNKDTVLAGTLVKEFKKTVSFPFTWLPQDSGELFAYRLYWELIKHFSLNGKEIFHSGRIPNNDQTDRYRLGWGGTKYGYFYQYYPNAQTTTEYSNRRGKKRELFEKYWKKMPEYAAGFFGPYIVKQFP